MDLASGYYQIPMKKEDKCKTPFYTRRGLMQCTVMPFGLTGAPSTFENLIEKVMRGLQWETCVLYLDDVICFGSDFSKTYQNLQEIFERFRQANLKLKVPSVSSFKNWWSF